MAVFQIILNSWGLAGIKPQIYKARIGEPIASGVDREYTQFEDTSTGNLTGDSVESTPTSWLGTPVFADVRFPRDGQEPIKLETVLVDVTQRKNIVTTAVQGRNGTVKEYVSDGDYDVRIRGAIVTPSSVNRYPGEAVRDLHELLSRSEAIEVVSDFLRLYNIYSIVVVSYSFPQQEGFQNTQLFEINCISDTPEELIIDDAQAQ